MPEADGWEGDDGLPDVENLVLDNGQREEYKTGDDSQQMVDAH